MLKPCWGWKLCPVVRSVHSSYNHLCLCLAGSSRPLGFPCVEKQQSYEHRFLFVSGDCVCLWLFALHLYSHSSKYHTVEQTLGDALFLVESSTRHCYFQPNTYVLLTFPFEFKVQHERGLGVSARSWALGYKRVHLSLHAGGVSPACTENQTGSGGPAADWLGVYKHMCLEWTNTPLKCLQKIPPCLPFLFFQILWIIPQKAVRWILVMIALAISGSVLAMTFWPAVREDNRRIALATIVMIVLLHMLLSVGCLVWPHSYILLVYIICKWQMTSNC